MTLDPIGVTTYGKPCIVRGVIEKSSSDVSPVWRIISFQFVQGGSMWPKNCIADLLALEVQPRI